MALICDDEGSVYSECTSMTTGAWFYKFPRHGLKRLLLHAAAPQSTAFPPRYARKENTMAKDLSFVHLTYRYFWLCHDTRSLKWSAAAKRASSGSCKALRLDAIRSVETDWAAFSNGESVGLRVPLIVIRYERENGNGRLVLVPTNQSNFDSCLSVSRYLLNVLGTAKRSSQATNFGVVVGGERKLYKTTQQMMAALLATIVYSPAC